MYSGSFQAHILLLEDGCRFKNVSRCSASLPHRHTYHTQPAPLLYNPAPMRMPLSWLTPCKASRAMGPLASFPLLQALPQTHLRFPQRGHRPAGLSRIEHQGFVFGGFCMRGRQIAHRLTDSPSNITKLLLQSASFALGAFSLSLRVSTKTKSCLQQTRAHKFAEPRTSSVQITA